MVSTLPPLVADGGELRLARRVASLVYGRREVTWPEDVADPEDDLPDGREFGWVAKLDGPEPGLSERRFVRADVSIDAVEKVSDVEQVLDDAALRAGGDVYFESLIEGKGLGLLKPGVDFDEGDLVDVRFWGRILKDQLVAAIDWDGDDPSVKLGGQSIRDTDSLARARAESLRLIRRERAERKDDVRAVDSKATQAKDTADEAKTTADEAKQDAEDTRSYIDEQLEAAGVAVELGRQYLESMRQHVAAGVAHSGLAQSMASEANAYAQRAIDILEQLDPLRDDVAAAHAEVARLHQEASQFTAQAADHVQQASQHAATAKGYAEQALEHEAEGRRQANAALDAAGAAQDSAALAQGILDDADGILSQVSGYSQEAKDALSGAESLLANAGGQGKSLGDVLLEVAQKQQETLTAHQDILDLHGEVLQKHGEAIRYVAAAAAQAAMAAMHAAQAAQEALNVAADAARAAGFAADAADEAAQAASNNSAAIGKLQEADGKLQEADQKLQAQIDILEDSQELLAKAVSLLSAGVAQAAASARNANKAAKSAGDAAGSALDAAESNSKAIAILNYERMRIAVRMSPQHDPSGNNKPPDIGRMEYYGTSSENEFLYITRSNGVRTSALQTTSPSGLVYRNFEYWDFDIHLLGNWSGVISWEAATGAIQDSSFRVMTVNIKNGEMAGARAFLDDPSNTNTTLRQVAQNALKRIAAPTTGGVVVVKVHPEYEEGKTNLGPYMP